MSMPRSGMPQHPTVATSLYNWGHNPPLTMSVEWQSGPHSQLLFQIDSIQSRMMSGPNCYNNTINHNNKQQTPHWIAGVTTPPIVMSYFQPSNEEQRFTLPTSHSKWQHQTRASYVCHNSRVIRCSRFCNCPSFRVNGTDLTSQITQHTECESRVTCNIKCNLRFYPAFSSPSVICPDSF